MEAKKLWAIVRRSARQSKAGHVVDFKHLYTFVGFITGEQLAIVWWYMYARTRGFVRNWSLTVCFCIFWPSGHDWFLSNLTTVCGDPASQDFMFCDHDHKFNDPLRWLCYFRSYMFSLFLSNLITLCGDRALRDFMSKRQIWWPLAVFLV